MDQLPKLAANYAPLSPLPELQDEWDAVTLNYTSGTTSAPKGVVYSHRGAYLSTTSLLMSWEATGPALACEWRAQWDNLPISERARLKARQGVSVLSLADADVVTDDAAMARVPRDGKTMGEIVLRGSSIMKGYLNNPEANEKAFRGGGVMTGLADADVVTDDAAMARVPRDGKTMGEIVLRGSSIMKGYLNNPEANEKAFRGGGVMTGRRGAPGRVEEALFRHPAVADAAVVAMPHAHWGETPCAFVVAKDKAAGVCEDDVMAFCRKRMARFMVPKKVVVWDVLPRNALGKVEKVKLREEARKLVPAVAVAPPAQKTKGKPTTKTVGGGRRDEHAVEQVMAMSRL
ncbi:2-succinylbenzoate--CoA ligase [Triticum urartu]|uniref:4-coumarate--CoA ligase n=1 Tax=Triticum urartu TaxID=4572 RepID=M7YP93_TRIUA|nr:2-succinylbenzoate--CoA ligase [Triticum urartu]